MTGATAHRADASDQANQFEQIIIIPSGSFTFAFDATFGILGSSQNCVHRWHDLVQAA
jgi:hypothetical protein